MGVTYQCEACGTRADVVAGASGFPGMSIHCPRCGGKAAYDPGAEGGDLIQVQLGDDGKSTRPISQLTLEEPDDGGNAPTLQVEGLDSADAGDPRHNRPTVRAVGESGDIFDETWSNDSKVTGQIDAQSTLVTTPDGELIEQSRRPVERDPVTSTDQAMNPTVALHSDDAAADPAPAVADTSPAMPPLAFTPAEAHAAVEEMLGAVMVAPESSEPDPVADSESDTDRGYPKRDFQSEAKDEADKMPGKAWSASVIRRALHDSGYEDSGPTDGLDDSGEAAPVEDPPTQLVAPPSVAEQVQVSVPESHVPERAAAAGHPSFDDTMQAEPVNDRLGESLGERLDEKFERAPILPSDAVTPRPMLPLGAPPVSVLTGRQVSTVESAVDSGVSESVLFQEQARRRQLTLTLLVIALLVTLGVLGYLLLQRGENDSAAPPGDPGAEDVDLLAQRRADSYGLEPIDRRAPFDVSATQELLVYPERLILSVRITNRSDVEISALHLAGAWHLVHDTPAETSAAATTFDRSPTLASPLSPGDSVTALLELETSFAPPGERDESFVWLELTAAGRDHLVFEGPVAMVEVLP